MKPTCLLQTVHLHASYDNEVPCDVGDSFATGEAGSVAARSEELAPAIFSAERASSLYQSAKEVSLRRHAAAINNDVTSSDADKTTVRAPRPVRDGHPSGFFLASTAVVPIGSLREVCSSEDGTVESSSLIRKLLSTSHPRDSKGQATLCPPLAGKSRSITMGTVGLGPHANHIVKRSLSKRRANEKPMRTSKASVRAREMARQQRIDDAFSATKLENSYWKGRA